MQKQKNPSILALIKRTIYHTKKHTMTLKAFYPKLKSLAKLQTGLVSLFLIFSTHTAISQIQDKQNVQDSTGEQPSPFSCPRDARIPR